MEWQGAAAPGSETLGAGDPKVKKVIFRLKQANRMNYL